MGAQQINQRTAYPAGLYGPSRSRDAVVDPRQTVLEKGGSHSPDPQQSHIGYHFVYGGKVVGYDCTCIELGAN